MVESPRRFGAETLIMPILVGLLVALFFVASPSNAQQPAWREIDLSAGYSFLRDQSSESSSQGWYVTTNYSLASRLGITGELSGYYGSGDEPEESHLHMHTFMAGPRYAFQVLEHSDSPLAGTFENLWYFTGFAYALIGAVRTTDFLSAPNSTETDFAFTAGVAGDMWMFRNGGIRLAVDYRRVFGNPAANQFRFLAGVVVATNLEPH
jgi:hypothetical protein